MEPAYIVEAVMARGSHLQYQYWTGSEWNSDVMTARRHRYKADALVAARRLKDAERVPIRRSKKQDWSTREPKAEMQAIVISVIRYSDEGSTS